MKLIKKTFAILSNVQILSALIWATVILGCSYVSKDPMISNILITAAGFHVILLTTKLSGKIEKRKTVANKN